MAELCNECLRPIKPFEMCSHGESELSADSQGFPNARQRLGQASASPWLLVLAPLGGVALDWVIPAWSALPTSLLLCLFGSIPLAWIWVRRNTGIPGGLSLKARFLVGAVVAPAGLRATMGSKVAIKFSALWCTSVLLSLLTVQAIATPANMSGLAGQVRADVKKQWNIGVNMRCSAPQIALPGRTLECTVSKRVVIDIKVPARVKVENWLGRVSWKVNVG